MAALPLPVGHSLYRNHSTIQGPRKTSSSIPRTLILLCCQSHKPEETSKPRTKKENRRRKSQLPGFLSGFDKFGKVMKENLSPRQKGDWKDVMLMSLSFAVYVYISQKIVCAYCAWMAMPKQPW
ncbi:hypothetical protein I3843_14G003200 [Carya illinoinensis]|nr:hypothetical protein I3760_14G003500 [Carya illinoinensis]KAG6676944.1 hypothetical protein I3842_14G003500 [Carya illinoinensis]KAG7945704.1 hypothetical protein I3843_14G003200 [Carya illinoinensis]